MQIINSMLLVGNIASTSLSSVERNFVLQLLENGVNGSSIGNIVNFYFTKQTMGAVRPRAHQGNWQPQRNRNFRELISASVEHMLLNGAAQIEETATRCSIHYQDMKHFHSLVCTPTVKTCMSSSY
jgi:hypothetical protein